MQTNSNGYTIGFAAVITVVCSLLLSGVSGALKEKQEENRLLDRQKNILVALGFKSDDLAAKEAADILSLFKSRVQEQVLDASGKVMTGKTAADLNPTYASAEKYNAAAGVVLYSLKNEQNPKKIDAYAYPVTGKGLWSTLYGYLAVKADGDEVVGLTFYKHGETPGLGAEIEAAWFRDNFVGKHLYMNGVLKGIEVVKGKVADSTKAADLKKNHMVDGMSGATLTGNGVSKMMRSMPKRYENFFKSLKAGGAQ